jgi:ABC-type uncharacterized transport system permease subunit
VTDAFHPGKAGWRDRSRNRADLARPCVSGSLSDRSLSALCQGAFGDWIAFTDSLVKATPLVFIGPAISVAFSTALWNIGADGQLVIGAIAAGAIGPFLGGWPRPLRTSDHLIAGALGAGAWSGICRWLRARRDTNEVISTIMLNFVAAQVLSWTVHGPLMETSRAHPQRMPIAPSAELCMFMPPTRLNVGMLLALLFAMYLFLFRSEPGFQLRAMGKIAARQISFPSRLVARLYPLAIIVRAIFFGALDNGSQAMQRAEACRPCWCRSCRRR